MMPGWIDEVWTDALARERGATPPPRPWFEWPAIGQLTVSRPELLRPFEHYNEAHPEAPVRPFNFVSVAYPTAFSRAERPRLAAPYTKPERALEADWYELRSGE